MPKRPKYAARGDGAVEKLDVSSEAAPVSDTELSSSRAKIPDAVPSAWLDRLLMAAVDLPLSSGEAAVVEALVQSVSSILPAYAIGASIAPRSGASGEKIIVRRLPDGDVMGLKTGTPPRLFPGFAHEYVIGVPPIPSDSTLHIASQRDDLDPSTSVAARLADRVALIMCRSLVSARIASAASDDAADSVRRLERQMIQAEKLATFGQLAAGLVHELNNPLTSIVAYSSYLLRKAADGSTPRDIEDVERLRRIQESANRMLRFTRDLVTYTRPSNDSRGPVVVHDVLDQAIAFCEHVLAASGVRVDRRYAEDVERIRGVGEQLVQVFVNLLTNACQATPATGGRIAISTSVRRADGRRRVVIDIADNGSGIAPEHLPQVFLPFFTTKRDSHGTGLGLSIVKSIVEGHDGSIRVESERGHGARFVVELPVERGNGTETEGQSEIESA